MEIVATIIYLFCGASVATPIWKTEFLRNSLGNKIARTMIVVLFWWIVASAYIGAMYALTVYNQRKS